MLNLVNMPVMLFGFMVGLLINYAILTMGIIFGKDTDQVNFTMLGTWKWKTFLGILFSMLFTAIYLYG